jgi:hydroxyacylglutathione hydrolase
MLQIHTEPVTPFDQNARILSCSESKEAVVIDPGGDADIIISAIKDQGLTCKAVWLTHSHLDHCGAVAPILKEFQVPLYGHPFEKDLRQAVLTIVGLYGLPPYGWENCPEPTTYITGGEELVLGKLKAKVLFTPGHSPGHLSFHFEDQKVVVSGDALFAGSIGRTDLPGGDHDTLIKSIEEKLLTLPDDTRVLSGHGEDTTIGAERKSNPFLSGIGRRVFSE